MRITDATPMEALSARVLPAGPEWWFEPKWDGFRCLTFKDGDEILLKAKSGKPLTRYFPEVADGLRALPYPLFAIDGELLIGLEGGFSFEALQLRLHPAESRIRKLAAEQPALIAAFDMLMTPRGEDLRAQPLSARRAALEAFAQAADAVIRLTPGTRDLETAQGWLSDNKGEGVIAKRWDGPYVEGERAMIKVKRQRTADCVVGGFRYAAAGKLVGSLLLGLYDDDGRLNHVGHTSGLSNAQKAELTRQLEGLKGGSGFTGDAPGGPSRWSTERSAEWVPLKPEMVVEVSFDHVSGGRFRHGTRLIRFRPDKAPRQCRMEQLSS